ncbi:uncharacterized protein LOC119448732 [Dermacentor silvarum]|uniref:uncharacterized protein LOC119448732 n=1 Tax=Dermacentor silvarum TaxID=543639 RepID=UPI002100A6A8|nr:uncharacterized protein LOC119448732 [Dermacentor silvarum]
MTPKIYQPPSPTAVGVYGGDDGSQVASFYKDRVVLITGGTGFVGKVLLEKLLRSCSGLKRVYLLMRSKKGKEPQSRLKEMFNSQVFERLKQEQPGAFEKVTALAGDIVQPDLGLSTSDRATLLDNVSVVFHSGAMIKFNETLRKTFEVNVLGTRRVLDLCRSAGKDVMGTTEQYLFGHPNTYTVTKSLAESLLHQERGDIPVAIVRPSIVTASLKEPLPVSHSTHLNMKYQTYAPFILTRVLLYLFSCDRVSPSNKCLGLLPLLITEKKNLADIVPVDIVANTLICVAWHTAKTRPPYMKVYHCTSGTLQQHTWAEVVDAMQRAILRHPLPNAISYPKIVMTNSQLWYDINLYCLRYLPALAADMALQLARRDPRFVQSYKKVRKSTDAAQYFVTHGWLFRTNNVVRLMRDLSPKDKQMFNIDMRSLDWYAYWDEYLLGIRKYLFRTVDSELPKAQRQLTRRIPHESELDALYHIRHEFCMGADRLLLFSRKCVAHVGGRRCTTTMNIRTVQVTTKRGRTAPDHKSDHREMHGAEQPVRLQLKTSAWSLSGKRPLHGEELQGRQRHLFPATSISCAEILSQTAHRQASTMTPEVYQPPSPTPVGVYGGNDGAQVEPFYKDRGVLITGGTGFVGKVLLEKLLRSCSGLKKVYLLVRTKKGQEPQARLEEMFNSKVFEHLKQQQPEVFEKVTALAGDLLQPDLGLSASDQATLMDNVSIVFHSGATIKFNEPLGKAVEVNLLGTRRVLDLCRQIPNICALVHVSTAYCNYDKPDVHEVIYPQCENSQEIIDHFQSAGTDATGTREECLFGHPNTYTLTKSLAEALLLEERGDIPVAIVRPSTITASMKEPLPGWVDNYNGCTGIAVTSGLGLLPLLLTEKKNLADIVPVDIVANTLICVAWHTAKTRPTYIKVYHCTSGTLQQHTWAELVDAMQRAILRHPLPNAISYPKIVVTNSQLWYDINLYCLRYLPALAADMALQLTRRDARFVKSYKKVRKGMDAAQYFVTHGWLFRTNNVVRLMHDLSPEDKQMFNVDMRSLDWYAYWEQYLLGIRKYIFKAEDSELPNAQRHLTRLYVVRLSLQALLLALACRLVTTQTAWNFGSTAMLLGVKTWKTLLVLLGLPPKL